MTDTGADHHYQEPGWFTRNIANRAVRRLVRWGVSVKGSRELQVRGRRTGELRSVPVNLLTHGDDDYLVAPRGETQWVRNLRVAGEGRLRMGRTLRVFHPTEIADDDKIDLLRAYLQRWQAEVKVFFGGVGADASDDELRAIAGRHPVFRIRYEDPAA